jgi:hypothetical protein
MDTDVNKLLDRVVRLYRIKRDIYLRVGAVYPMDYDKLNYNDKRRFIKIDNALEQVNHEINNYLAKRSR